MNDILSKLAWGVAGAIVGAVAMYFIQDKRLAKKFEKELDAYMNPVTEEETPSDDPNNDLKESDAPVDPNTIPQAAVDACKAMQEGARKVRDIRNGAQYSSLSRNNDPKEMPVDGEPTFDGHHRSIIQGGRDMFKPTAKDPYYITESQFRELDDRDTGYDCYDLYYNTDDDSICYPDGEVIEDGHLKVGWDIMQDMYDSVDKEFYVKNENLKEAYCIVKNVMID